MLADLGGSHGNWPLGPAEPGRAGPLTRAWAWLRRGALDRALARGANPIASGPLAHRAARLTGERNRKKLAGAIDDVLESASKPPPVLTSAISPARDEVISAGPLLRRIEAMLRSGEPVYCQGIAMLSQLLRDGASPFYSPSRPGDLSGELERVLALLEGREEGWPR